MLFGHHAGELEVRAGKGGSRRLSGRFPYNKVAVLSDGGKSGRPQKEQFASRAFGYSVDAANEGDAIVHLLVGHSFDKPLASTDNKTLHLTDSDDALTFDATITPDLLEVSYVSDILALIAAGLAIGLSPGFRIPPKRAVSEAERITQEPVDPSKGMHGAIIRTILAAILFELSIVTRPAYDQTQVEARNWTVENGIAVPTKKVITRWRRELNKPRDRLHVVPHFPRQKAGVVAATYCGTASRVTCAFGMVNAPPNGSSRVLANGHRR
jgi:uncharacterized protein